MKIDRTTDRTKVFAPVSEFVGIRRKPAETLDIHSEEIGAVGKMPTGQTVRRFFS